jgi:hypothetical protein
VKERDLMFSKPSYFLIALSNKLNLELCVKYSLAGFPSSTNGLWAYSDIEEGDYISFLYGAKAYNLYRVERKEALRNAQNLPPWDPIVFKNSGKTYYFPFRLTLAPIRKLEETLVRVEFAYVAENLLLRGGYRRTHFQADQTTLSSVSQMGNIYEQVEKLNIENYETFNPRFTKNKSLVSRPEVFPLQEVIIQALIRRYLIENSNLSLFLRLINIEDLEGKTLESFTIGACGYSHKRSDSNRSFQENCIGDKGGEGTGQRC